MSTCSKLAKNVLRSGLCRRLDVLVLDVGCTLCSAGTLVSFAVQVEGGSETWNGEYVVLSYEAMDDAGLVLERFGVL